MVGLAQRLAEAEATIRALLAGQIDSVVDDRTQTPVLLAKAQQALRESEERYRSIVETTNEGIGSIDAEGNVTFVNARLAEMLEYTPAELVGMSLFKLLPNAPLVRFALARERLRDPSPQEFEYQFTTNSGLEVWALLRTSPLRGADGEYVGTLAMVTDWSRRRQEGEALRQSEEQYRQIVETTTDGIIKIDDRSRVVYVNSRMVEMLGYAVHEILGKRVFAFMDATARTAVLAAIRNRTAGRRYVFDTHYRHQSGSEISVSVAGAPVLDKQGTYAGSLGIVRDVTEQRKLQAQLIVSDRMASIGTLAAGVAHEINNPLAAVIANLDFIAENTWNTQLADPAAERQSHSISWLLHEMKAPLEDARDAAQRVRFIVRDLKIFSSSAAEELSGSINVKSTMESTIRMAWNEVRHRAQLVKNYGDVPNVRGHEARLGQVFLNLLVNAAQALPEGEAEHNQIRIDTRADRDRVVIEVSDTGAGIRAEDVGRVFDAFFTTKAVGVGTGLGLAICQRIVTDMGGAITVASVIGKGTTFSVSLPVARAQPSTNRIPRSVVKSGRKGKLLVVDDDPLVLRSIARVLSVEHEVTALTSAREALALCAASNVFDLILCDLMMPDMTGMEFYRELNTIAPAQANRMVFVTGGAFTESARRFLANTPNQQLEKPVDYQKVRAILRRYLH